MATTITLEGAARTEFGKGAARRMRVANLIPATVYAGGEDPTFVQLPMKETTLALRHPAFTRLRRRAFGFHHEASQGHPHGLPPLRLTVSVSFM